MPEAEELEARIKRVERYLRKKKSSQIDDDAIERIDELLGQAKEYRDERKELLKAKTELEAKVAELEKNPKLTDDDVKDLEAYRKLGKPDEVKTAVEAGTLAAESLKKQSRKDLLSEAAKAYGWSTDALVAVDELSGGELQIEKAVIKDPKKGDVAQFYAVVDGKKTPYDEYVKGKHPVFMPSLSAQEAPAGRRLPPQRGAGPPPTTTVPDDAIRDEQDQRLSTAAML